MATPLGARRDFDPAAHEAAVREQCASRGISVRPRGRGWLLQGAGVSLLVADLSMVDLAKDLLPLVQIEVRPQRPRPMRGTGGGAA